MDVASIALILVSALDITKSVLQFAKQLKDVNDPKIKVIRTSLLTQNRRTRGWFQRMNIGDRITLQKRIDPEDLELVQEFLDDIIIYEKRANAALERFLNPLVGKSKYRQMKAKLWWISGGYDDMNLLVKALELLNDALYEFTDPPPPYPRSPWQSPRAQNSPLLVEERDENSRLPEQDQLQVISEAFFEALRRSDPTSGQRATQSETTASTPSLAPETMH